MKKVSVAVVQAGSVAFDRARTLEKLRSFAADAGKKKANIILFPEAFVSGYPKGLDFGARVGYRTPAGRDDFARYFDSAIDVPGPDCDFIGKVAAENNAYLVVGVIERDIGTLYCTVLFFGPDGRYLGKHRKLMPTAMERLIWGYGDGSTLPVFDTPFGKLGAVICWENYMPLLRTAMYAKGVQIYCAPTADGRKTWLPSMQHIAMEGRCFVLSCNQFTKRRDFPADYDCGLGNDPETPVSDGGSCIVGPLGEVLAGPLWGGEGVITADLDLTDIARGKFDFDVVGHYARPDVFRLHVNESEQPAVVSNSREAGDPFAPKS